MKKSSIVVVSLFMGILAVGLAGCTQDYPSEIKAYGFDTAFIQYDLSGAEAGSMSVYIRGDQKAVLKTVEGAEGVAVNTLELSLGDIGYVVDMDAAIAVKVANAEYVELKKMSPEEQEVYLVKEALGLKTSAQAPEPLNVQMVAGHECNLYLVQNIGSACVWNGLVLEKEITIAGLTNKQVATEVQVDVAVPAERFELPANVIVK